MDYTIRNIREAEYKVLSDFLLVFSIIPEGVKAPSKDIINKLEFRLSNAVNIAPPINC